MSLMRTVCFFGPVGLMDISPVRLSDVVVGETLSWMEVFQVRVLDVQTKSLISQGKAQSSKFPPDFMLLCQ